MCMFKIKFRKILLEEASSRVGGVIMMVSHH
jgi:hypothetical protein